MDMPRHRECTIMIYYPDDDDGDALRRVAEHGADMSQPMRIEFSINVSDVERAHTLAKRIAAEGYIPNIFVDDESGSVSIYWAKTSAAPSSRQCSRIKPVEPRFGVREEFPQCASPGSRG
jgi:Regulator of ribonuclease activity B